MEKDVKRLDAMNSNYEGRKHGKPSEIFVLQRDFANDHNEIARSNNNLFIWSKECLPVGQRIKEGSREEFSNGFSVIMTSGAYKVDESLESSNAMRRAA